MATAPQSPSEPRPEASAPQSSSPPSTGFSSLFNAPTDIPAFLVIALGIAIAALMEDLPVRLIGVCISILGSIALFVLYAQRVKDLSALQPTMATKPVKTVSEVSDFKTTVKQESGSKRLVFDDFAESFGVVEDSPEVSNKQAEQPKASLKEAGTIPSGEQVKTAPKAQPVQPPKQPASASTTALPKRLVFDDFDDAAGFDDVDAVQLVTAPEKYTVQAPPPVLPDIQETSNDASSGSTPPSGKKVLVFDDNNEAASSDNDFQPNIAVGATSLPDSLKKAPEPKPVTPPPAPFTRPLPTSGNYIAPKLDETLLGADFEDEEGGEFRIVGKASDAGTTAPINTSNDAVREDIPSAKKKGDEEIAVPAIPNPQTEQIPNIAPYLASEAPALIEETPTPSSNEVVTEAEAVQDKVSRASKAALHLEMVEISAVSAQIDSVRSSADAVAAAQAADLKNYRASERATERTEKIDASKIAAGQVSTELSEEAVSHRRKKLSVTMDDIAEETPEVVKNEPRREFDFLLQRILMAIRSAMNARTTAYWWYAADRRTLTMEAKISDVSDMAQNRTIALSETDAVSQIASNGTPEILSEISADAELQLLPYYTTPAKTRSFVGVPVFYNNAVVGILTADSTEDDAYDNATVSFLGHFTKLISGLIQSYTEKYDLLQAARTLEAIDTFRQLTLKPERTGEDICTALIRSLMRLVPYSTMGTCIYNDDDANWYVSNMHTKTPEARSILGAKVALETSLLGKTISNGRTYRFANPASTFTRIAEQEQKPETLAFTAVPLVSVSRCYGALFIEESGGETRLTKQDIEILETACEYAGTALEQIQLQDYVQTHAMYRESSDERVVSAIDFVERARQEMVRTREAKLTFSVALVQLDEYAAFASNDALREELFLKFVEAVKKNAREYDVIGRYVGNVVGVCLTEKNSNEARMWAERLRREIASVPLNVNGKQFTITVSIGVAEFLKQSTLEELLRNAEQALDAAVRKTNSVSIFS